MRYLILFLLSGLSVAQVVNNRFDSVASSPRGPIPFATVAVCTQPANTTTQPCSPLANLCSSLTDTGCTSLNPLIADNLGNFHFYVKQSQAPVSVQIYGPTVLTPYVLADQSSQSVGTITSINTTAPITGGPITSSGTIGCATCAVNGAWGSGTTNLIPVWTSSSQIGNTDITFTSGSPNAYSTPGKFSVGQLSINSSQFLTGVQGSTGVKTFTCTGSFTSGNLVKSDANGNCADSGVSSTTVSNAVGGDYVQSTLLSGCGATCTFTYGHTYSSFHACVCSGVGGSCNVSSASSSSCTINTTVSSNYVTVSGVF